MDFKLLVFLYINVMFLLIEAEQNYTIYLTI